MQRHSDKCSTQDSTASLLLAAVATMNSCQLFCVCGMQGSVNSILHVHIIYFALL